MLDLIGARGAGRLDLGALAEGLRGLYAGADPHDAGIRAEFEAVWPPLGAEDERRTEPWAPARSASDDALGVALIALTGWVAAVLAANSALEHGEASHGPGMDRTLQAAGARTRSKARGLMSSWHTARKKGPRRLRARPARPPARHRGRGAAAAGPVPGCFMI